MITNQRLRNLIDTINKIEKNLLVETASEWRCILRIKHSLSPVIGNNQRSLAVGMDAFRTVP